jgi:16S rRNA (cytosine1402-N4)-methyltransferase
MSKKHTPVFLNAVMEALQVKPGEKYIDCTAGEGGHLKSIAERGGIVLGIDYDAAQIKALIEQIQMPNVTLVNGNFKNVDKIAKQNGFLQVHGILIDLGLSMRQYTSKEIGLSYANLGEKLDMRLEANAEPTAADILNKYDQDELREMLMKNSEEVFSSEIAYTIVRARESQPINTVGELIRILKKIEGSSNPMISRVFQALRMEVNHEIDNVREALDKSIPLLLPGGRLIIITFHSIEDRIVKEFGRKRTDLKVIKVKVTHQDRQRFERSAQLRIFELI